MTISMKAMVTPIAIRQLAASRGRQLELANRPGAIRGRPAR